MLPINDPTAVVVEHYQDLLKAINSNHTHLAFYENCEPPAEIKILLDILAKSDAYFLIEKSSYEPYFRTKKGTNTYDCLYNMESDLISFLSDINCFESNADAIALAKWLLQETDKNFALVSQAHEPAENLYSRITTNQANTDIAPFAHNWHQDANKKVLISAYAGQGTLFKPQNSLLQTLKDPFPTLNGKDFYYQLPVYGKSMHKGEALAGKNAQYHRGVHSTQRIVGIASNF